MFDLAVRLPFREGGGLTGASGFPSKVDWTTRADAEPQTGAAGEETAGHERSSLPCQHLLHTWGCPFLGSPSGLQLQQERSHVA